MQNRKLARATLMLLLVGGSAYAQKKDKAIHFGNEKFQCMANILPQSCIVMHY